MIYFTPIPWTAGFLPQDVRKLWMIVIFDFRSYVIVSNAFLESSQLLSNDNAPILL